MTVEAAIGRLRELAATFDEWERPGFTAPASRSAVTAIQQAIGAELLADLWAFFAECDEVVAMDIHNGYRLGGSKWVCDSVRAGTFPRDVATENGPNPVVPFATDGGGNAFLVGLRREGVWSWDYETGRTAEVAVTFAAFLTRVAEDWEHFAAGDHDWDYLVSPPRRHEP